MTFSIETEMTGYWRQGTIGKKGNFMILKKHIDKYLYDAYTIT